MARDLTAAWEFLTGATRARQRLATARPMIWDRARLPTAEHTTVVRPLPAGDRGPAPGPTDTDPITIRVSVETHLKDGRRLVSGVDLMAGPRRWRVRPFVALADAPERPLWQGQAIDREDSTGFADLVDSAANAVIEATMSLDFAAIEEG